MASDFGVTVVSLQNTLNVFLVGYAIGQFFGGALSDQIGRKRVGYSGLVVYLVTSIAIAFAGSVEQMLTLRFFQAVGGGFSTVICLATVRDIYPVEQLGRRFATVTMVLLVAPLVAPALGAAVLPLGWEMIFVLKAVYAGVLLAVYAFVVPETRPGRLGNSVAALRVPAVLRRRAAARRLASPADSLRDGHGVLGVVHDDLRHQLVVHLHGVLRRRARRVSRCCSRSACSDSCR